MVGQVGVIGVDVVSHVVEKANKLELDHALAYLRVALEVQRKKKIVKNHVLVYILIIQW